ncbi:cation channel sperm-associated auxiliary subunit zeta isoform X4 [Macaca fascicularis]|uniref:cation channel sperm-associated auxiliary subunit zeta isoform X4 n=1 Tax=Macaca fascicularis TaxID=9541 RepID=UPI003D1539A1
MEEKPSKVSLKSSDRHDSDKESVHSDIRDLWTTTTLSQAQLNMPLSEVCEGFDAEGRSISKTRGWYSPGSRSLDEGDKASHKPEEMDEHALVELELHRGSSMEINPGEKDTASQIEAAAAAPDGTHGE